MLFVLSDKLETARQELVLQLQQAAVREAATHVQGTSDKLQRAGCILLRTSSSLQKCTELVFSFWYELTLHLWRNHTRTDTVYVHLLVHGRRCMLSYPLAQPGLLSLPGRALKW